MKQNQKDLSLTRADIITERLILRPSDDVRDLADYLSHLEAANEYFIQYGEERSAALIETIDFHTAPVCYYTVFRKDTDVMAGYVGITPLREQKAGNLKFYIFREFRRNRYAHEALTALIEWFFDGRLTGEKYQTVIAENEPSIRLLEALKFKREAAGFRLLSDADEQPSCYGMARYVLQKSKSEVNSNGYQKHKGV